MYSERGLTPGTNGNPNIGVGDFSTKGVKINTDAITYITSGLIDLDRNVVLSYLHKAIKPVNSLRMMEDALVIYRMSRAPERRIFFNGYALIFSFIIFALCAIVSIFWAALRFSLSNTSTNALPTITLS